MERRAVLFDFDYTLGDSSRGIVQSTNHALESMGLSRCEEAAICRLIGLSLPEIFNRLTGNDLRQEGLRFMELYLDHASRTIVDATEWLPEAREVIASLHRSDVRLGIVSTKFHRTIRAILARDGLQDTFDVIVGGDDVRRYKPDPEGLELALRRLQLDPQKCLYVGDSVVDARAACAAGVQFVGVLTGPTARSELESAGAQVIIDRLTDLLDLR